MKGDKMNRKLLEWIKKKIRLMPGWLKQNLANIVTSIGIVTTVWFLVTAYYAPEQIWLIDLLALITAFTDYIDGLIAKRYGSSVFGSLIDRIRDRVFVYPALSILVWHHRWRLKSLSALSAYLALGSIALIVVFEILLFIAGFIGAYWYYIKKKEIDLAPNKWGKKKTFCGFAVVLIWLASLTVEKYLGFPLIKFSIYLIFLGFVLMPYWMILSIDNYWERAKPLVLKSQELKQKSSEKI